MQEKARSHDEIMDVRLYLNEGQIVDVDPLTTEHKDSLIDPAKHTIIKKRVRNVKGQGIEGASPVMIGKKSPSCSYWMIYETESGYIKICIY